MLQALLEAEILPDVIIGTSIGAVNGAMLAADPSLDQVERMRELWSSLRRADVFGGSFFNSIRTLARSRTHVYSNDRLRELLTEALDVERIEDLSIAFECVASSIEGARARYFDRGPIVDAVLASAAVPGLLPPVEIDGEHFLDGGLVASIPLDRAIELGATDIYVLQVGRVEQPLRTPAQPWEVALVAFEISRRYRFLEALAAAPDHVRVSVLPTGAPKDFDDLKQYRDLGDAERLIGQSHAATASYLREHGIAT
ncbi:MAG: patatin-like phospholipase family protein [Ilumatobacter sp.]|nr:patatin-like phospholipase family protein [Ilumatobacter sp.]